MKIQYTLLTVIALYSMITIGCTSDLPPEGRADMNDVQDLRTKFTNLGSASDSADSSDAAMPTGHATLKGQFTLNGPIPEPSKLKVDKDMSVCNPENKPIFADDVIVDEASKGIANIVIFAEIKNEDWIHESAKTAAEPDVIFDQKECVFLTRVVAMQTSQTLKAYNSDSVAHNLNVKNFNKVIKSGSFLPFNPDRQDKNPQRMTCSIHPWMQAWFIARDDGYFAVTDKNGNFEIPNLPAGVAVDFKVWHERTGTISGQISVNGSSEKWRKGKFSRTLTPDQPSEMAVVIDSSMFK